jgi:trans-feruloyl-CoA hydratase/vanillin synthase
VSTVSTEKPVPGGKDVLVEFEDGIAWVSLNRPQKRNAMSADLAFEMLSVLEALEIDERAGVLVLTGTGETFSAGMDLKDYFRATDGMPVLERLKIYRANALWQWRLLAPYPKPTIAMVNGWCFGGAFTPLISCDLAIAAEDATFGLSEINWGIIPAGIVTKAVEQVMNQRDCLYYIMTGETFDGKRAKEMGLVNDAVPKEQLRERTRKLARTLLEKNPVVLRAAKQAYKHVRHMNWEQAADYLASKMDQVSVQDRSGGREQGMKQFLDDKTYKPGLGAYKKS